MRVPHVCHIGCTIPPSDHTDWIVEEDMTGNIENAARTLGDAIRSAAEIIAAALRQNSWTYQPPVQTIPNTLPYVPYQPYTSPTIQPGPIYPTITCQSGTNSSPRTATGALCQNDAAANENANDREFVPFRFAGSAGEPDIRFSDRHD